MCGTCGCGESEVRVDGAPAGRAHPHTHDAVPGVVEIETALLAKNDHLAGHNRSWLADRGIVALNLMSSPGSGKTSLLRRTIDDSRRPGRSRSSRATRRRGSTPSASAAPAPRSSRSTPAPAAISTPACWPAGWPSSTPATAPSLFVENVGNLVCPALFDLGEAAKVVVVSVTEGEDKPLKYPHMFAVADVVVINKVDLLPYVDVELDRLVEHCRTVNPRARVLPLSVTTGQGMAAWRDWLLTCTPAAGTSVQRRLDSPPVGA